MMFTLKKTSMLRLAVRRLRGTRSFLTDAYRCDDVWQERLACSLLKKVNHEELYYKLSSLFDNDKKQVSAIDLDVFANSLTDSSYLEELDDLTHKFRLSAQSGSLLPSTHHAFIRLYLATDNTKDLIRILRDRLNYGIFPDYYLSNLLMDRFLKINDFRNAAIIASNQMLQEELDNDITKTLGLYSCLKYIVNPTEWEDPLVLEEKTEEEEDEEETRIRVAFLRNPYFDDHFDLTDGDHLVGNTMLAICKTDNTVLGNSFKAIGLAYYNRWNELSSYLQKLDGAVFTETVEFAVASIDKRSPEISNQLKDAFAKLKVDSKSLTEETKNAINVAVNKNEGKEIQLQNNIYKGWESFRREELHRYMEHLNKMKRLQKVQQVKQELKEKEQLIMFFDDEDKHDLVNEEKLMRMKKKVAKVQSPKEDLAYIPPEIRKPGFRRE